eukprot:364321-Chlamydomonas_euryale.AAC.10
MVVVQPLPCRCAVHRVARPAVGPHTMRGLPSVPAQRARQEERQVACCGTRSRVQRRRAHAKRALEACGHPHRYDDVHTRAVCRLPAGRLVVPC